MFLKSLFWPIADVPPWHAPPAVVQKNNGRCGQAARQRRRLWRRLLEKASQSMNFARPPTHKQMNFDEHTEPACPLLRYKHGKERHNDCTFFQDRSRVAFSDR